MLRLRSDFPRTELFSLKRWKCSVKAVSMHYGGRRNPHSGGNGGHSPGNRLGTFFFPLWQLVVETTLTLLDAGLNYCHDTGLSLDSPPFREGG